MELAPIAVARKRGQSQPFAQRQGLGFAPVWLHSAKSASKLAPWLSLAQTVFNGNPQAALKNLPAYVVSRVKVYEKEGDLSQTAGADMGDKQYVMDVHLKREYIGTYIGQIKAGYGTEDRYDAGFFAMRFDDRQSFSLSGDFNNVFVKPAGTKACFRCRGEKTGAKPTSTPTTLIPRTAVGCAPVCSPRPLKQASWLAGLTQTLLSQ